MAKYVALLAFSIEKTQNALTKEKKRSIKMFATVKDRISNSRFASPLVGIFSYI